MRVTALVFAVELQCASPAFIQMLSEHWSEFQNGM